VISKQYGKRVKKQKRSILNSTYVDRAGRKERRLK
jgi:hypothetical protein